MEDEKNVSGQMLDVANEIERLWQYLGHRKQANELHARASEIEAKVADYKKDLEEMFRRQYEEASRYFNTVMVVGYAGYFATWTLIRSDIDTWHASFIGLMGMLSLSIFILWELFCMRMRMTALAELSSFFRNMISVDDFEPLRREQLSREAQRMMWARPIWVLVFFTSAGTAVIGAIDLILQLYTNLQ